MRLSKSDPVGFATRVGGAIRGVDRDQRESEEAFAARVAEFLLLPAGEYPRASERTLWRIWSTVR
jgi:hypothetical protein